MSDQSGGPGWWLASDGKWYPPELASPSAAPVSFPPPAGPAWTPPAHAPSVPPPLPERPGGRGVTVGIVIGGLLTLVVLALLVAGFVNRDRGEDGTDLETASPSSEGGADETTTTDGGGDGALPPAFEQMQGDGVSAGLPEGWTQVTADDMDLPVDQLAELFPDADPEMLASFPAMFEQGAVLLAVDSRAVGSGANINVLEFPAASDLDLLETQAVEQLETLGGQVVENTQVDLPAGRALRMVYEFAGGQLAMEGAQYYLSIDGRTYIVSVTTGREDAATLGDQIMQTFRVDG